MTHLHGIAHRLLRVPLFYKILLANCAIVAVGAIGGTLTTVWHMETYPDDPHYELMVVFGVVGFAISFAVNLLVLRLALRPLDRLQDGVDAVRKGDLTVRVVPEPLSDERFDRLLATFNQMLGRLEDDTHEMHRLSGEILQAQEEERRRVARELHDEAAQALTSLLVRVRLLERSATPDEARQHVQELRKLTAEALEEVRRVALELRPTILDDLGLVAALGWRVDEFNAASAARVTLTVAGLEERLPATVELAFYRVAQEALTNVLRHAHAQNARVTVRREDGWVMLDIVDDGMGFDPQTPRKAGSHGLGLVGMRERMALIGGELNIQAAEGGGTRITARAPVNGMDVKRGLMENVFATA
ncbi:MAG: HAMP domain-containing protein [Anaerolineae bacterium]|nr:HAMP domain-containing protein [Anaerolineae bacterium]